MRKMNLRNKVKYDKKLISSRFIIKTKKNKVDETWIKNSNQETCIRFVYFYI
jgi:hypothetical protein